MGTLFYLAGPAITLLLGIIVVPLSTRVMTTGEMGEYGAFLIAFGAFSHLVSFSSNSYYKMQREHSIQTIVQDGLKICVSYLVGSVLCFGTYILLKHQSFFDAAIFSEKLIFVALAAAIGRSIFMLYLGYLQSNRQPAKYMVMEVVANIILFCLTLFVLYCVEDKVMGRMFAMLIWSTIAVIILLRYLLLLNAYKILPFSNNYILFGIKSLPHTMAVMFVGFFDRLYISANFSLDILGVFTVSLTLATGFYYIFDSIGKSSFVSQKEALKRGDMRSFLHTIFFNLIWMFCIFLVAVIGLFLAIQLIGQNFYEVKYIFPFLVFIFMLRSLSQQLSLYFLVLDKPEFLSIGTLIYAGMMLSGCYLFDFSSLYHFLFFVIAVSFFRFFLTCIVVKYLMLTQECLK